VPGSGDDGEAPVREQPRDLLRPPLRHERVVLAPDDERRRGNARKPFLDRVGERVRGGRDGPQRLRRDAYS